jgi:hypothetical protein
MQALKRNRLRQAWKSRNASTTSTTFTNPATTDAAAQHRSHLARALTSRPRPSGADDWLLEMYLKRRCTMRLLIHAAKIVEGHEGTRVADGAVGIGSYREELAPRGCRLLVPVGVVSLRLEVPGEVDQGL